MSCLFGLLDDAALQTILCQFDTPQDLLRLSRSCHRLHDAVQQAQEAWQQLWNKFYSRVTVPPHRPLCYRQLFKDRWVKEARERRLQHRVQRMRLQSDVAQLQRDLGILQSRLKCEHQVLQSNEQELRKLHRMRHAHSNSQSGQWQLGAVQLYNNRLMQAAPVRLEAKLAGLQQEQKVGRLEIATIKASIDSHRQRLRDTKRRLAALQG